MKLRTYLLLGILVSVMALIYFFGGPSEPEEATYSIPDRRLSINASRVVTVDIKARDSYVRIERINDVWRLTEPINSELDSAALHGLLHGLARFKLLAMVSSNPQKRGVFQVDERGTSVVFTSDDGKKTPIIVGKSAPAAGQAYVRPPSSDTVYLAQGLTPLVVDRSVRDWRHRAIYAAHPEEIQSVSIRSGEDLFLLRRSGRAWMSNFEFIPNRLMTPALQVLSNVRAEDFVDTTLIITHPPSVEVAIEATEPVRMYFYERVLPGNNVVLKTSRSPSVFVVDRAAVDNVQRLVEYLKPPAPIETPPQITPQVAAKPQAPPVRTQELSPDPLLGRSARQEIEDEGELTIHTVRRGETLEAIARKYNVTADQIRKWNQLTKDTVSPNTELYIFVRRK